MKREILFRGLRTDGKGWVYGYYFYDIYTEFHYIIDETSNIEVIPETAGQYTGRKDKNGVNVFEGDRVKYLGATGVVIYESENAMYMVKFDLPMVSSYSFDSIGEDFEVIGNIHEK